KSYVHGTISSSLNGRDLPNNYFLQHAEDYTKILEESVQLVLKDGNVDPSSIIGIGVDFTSCTIVFLDNDFKPLHTHENLKDNPHAYVNSGSITALKKKLRL